MASPSSADDFPHRNNAPASGGPSPRKTSSLDGHTSRDPAVFRLPASRAPAHFLATSPASTRGFCRRPSPPSVASPPPLPPIPRQGSSFFQTTSAHPTGQEPR